MTHDIIKQANLFIEKAHSFIDKGYPSEIRHLIDTVKKEDIEKLQKFLMEKSLDWVWAAYWCYYFAERIEGADIKALQEVVIKSGNAETCYDFACKVKGADKKALQQAVLESSDPEWCYLFALNIKGADIKALQQVVIESGEDYWCYHFAKYIEGADAEALGIEELPAYNEEYGFLYHHKPTKTLQCGCRCFTYEEAIEHWKNGSESGGETFAQKCVKIAEKLLQQQEN